MCLNRGWEKYKKVVDEERWAWKWIRKVPSGTMFTGYTNDRIVSGEWLRAQNAPNPYGPGFHVYVERQSRQDMPNYIHYESKMVRVKVRGIHTYGTQDGARCWVANEMFVPVPRKRGARTKKKQETKLVKQQTKTRVKRSKAV